MLICVRLSVRWFVVVKFKKSIVKLWFPIINMCGRWQRKKNMLNHSYRVLNRSDIWRFFPISTIYLQLSHWKPRNDKTLRHRFTDRRARWSKSMYYLKMSVITRFKSLLSLHRRISPPDLFTVQSLNGTN